MTDKQKKAIKREEQIEVATAAYINGRLRNNVPPEEIEEIRLAYQAGAIYADKHPDLYSVTRKTVEREREYMIRKACEWLNNFYNEETNSYLIKEDIDAFRKAMEGQQ